METTQITMTQQTVVEQIYEQLKVNDPDFWNADMIRDWLIENKEMFLKMEKEQIVKAFNEGTFSLDEKINVEQYYNETYKK